LPQTLDETQDLTMNEVAPTWLTQDAYDALAAELEQLMTVGRTEIAKKIQDAREEGDLKENGGYHAAKDEQGRIEARINRLENILASSVVGEAPQTHGVVEQGVIVKVLLNDNENEFLLGSAEMAEVTDLTVYSPDSPIGNAIIGKKIGDEVSYTAPNGRAIKVEIVDVRHFSG
jgi:transcription elongation factor GreA